MKINKNDVIISLHNINKVYTISHGEKFYALKNINLKIMRGDRVGIIGLNGAGKTTLLKIIGGITKPTSGKITRNGKVVSIIDLEAGFDQELTGYENIIVNGLLVGMTKKEILSKIPSIINFAGIGKFIYEPFYTYSAGMKFRLAFSIAIKGNCDILIIDEIFTSTDLKFQKKTLYTIDQAKKNKNMTLVICSHSPNFIWRFCDQFYSIQKNSIKKRSSKLIWKEIEHNDKLTQKIFRLNLNRIK